MMQDSADLLARIAYVACASVRAAGEVHRRYRDLGRVPYHFKNNDPSNLVTPVDQEAQSAAAAVIAASDLRPTLIVGEESCMRVEKTGKLAPASSIVYDKGEFGDWVCPDNLEDGYWLIDGLDGTLNYVRGGPTFAAAVAYVRDGVVEVGAVYAPLLDELYCACRGMGATLDGKGITVAQPGSLGDALSARDEIGHSGQPRAQLGLRARSAGLIPSRFLRGAVIAIDSPRFLTDRTRDTTPGGTGESPLDRLLQQVGAVRTLGSPVLGLARVACGRIDGYAYRDAARAQRSGPWDFAAGQVLIEEAGGVVSRPDGTPMDIWKRGIIASSSVVMRDALIERLFALPR